MLKPLNEAHCRAAIATGEFGTELLSSAPAVAIVMTQTWCPQWVWMRRYLDRLPEAPGRVIYFIEYDREVFFEDFMSFKEQVFGNHEIPYVRYYRNGAFYREGNYIDESGFLRLLG